MNTLKRLTATLSAQINSMVDQLENHEAVANMALEEIRESMMHARFQIRRVQNEQRLFEQRFSEMKREEEKWTQRALQSQTNDREKALECVRRLKKTKEDMNLLNQQILQHGTLEEQLTEDVLKIENKFEDLKRKRNLLVARQSRSQALTIVSENGNSANLENVFERWEKKVLRSEVESEIQDSESDFLVREFNQSEDRVELETLLQELSQDKIKSK